MKIICKRSSRNWTSSRSNRSTFSSRFSLVFGSVMALIFLLTYTCLSAQTPSFQLRNYSELFKAHSAIGSITLYNPGTKTWISSDRTDWNVSSTAASTFKIVNSLIALETKTIPNANEVFTYHGQHDTSLYGVRTDVYHDMDMVEAFQRSSVWYYLELAEIIGCEKYLEFLEKIPYGNGKVCGDELDFWNYGEFEVTPFEQILLLSRLISDQLPFAKEHQKTLKEIMINDKYDPYILRAKTGWGRDKTHNIGWWVGYVEHNDQTWIFATRIRRRKGEDLEGFTRSRKDITLAVLRDLGIIE